MGSCPKSAPAARQDRRRTGAWGSIRRLSSRCAGPCRRSSGPGEKLPAIGQMGCTGYARIHAASPAARSPWARRPGLPVYRCMGFCPLCSGVEFSAVRTVRLVLPAGPGPGEKSPAIGQVGCTGYARINAGPAARSLHRAASRAPPVPRGLLPARQGALPPAARGSLQPSVPRAASRAHAAGQGRLSPRLRCSPGGSPPRASRGPRRLTPWLRSSGRVAARKQRRAARSRLRRTGSGPASTRRARGARVSPMARCPSPQADSRCPQPPRQAVGARPAPTPKRGCHGPCTKPQPVTAVACTG
jgi:hypothetical protein